MFASPSELFSSRICDFVEMMFWVKFYMVSSAFSCLETIRQLLESNLGIGKLQIGIFG